MLWAFVVLDVVCLLWPCRVCEGETGIACCAGPDPHSHVSKRLSIAVVCIGSLVHPHPGLSCSVLVESILGNTNVLAGRKYYFERSLV